MMEQLFSTNISVDKRTIAYRVVFDREQYHFYPEGQVENSPKFALTREHDTWTIKEDLPPDIRQQAVDALEKYLLKQH